MRPENREQFQRIFGYTPGAFPIDKDPLKWFEELEALRRPEVLSSDDVAKIDPVAREGYLSKHEAYRAKEHEYEKVKEEMRKRALGKMVIVNKAFEAAKSRFSESELSSLAGFI